MTTSGASTPCSRAEEGASAAREVDVLIIGAGFGGLCMAIALRKAGREDFVLLEQDHEVGGTWRDNTYPGCACDVQSHMYSYSFEGNPAWSRRYASWDEIQAYILRTTEKYGLRPFIRFGAEVNGAVFDADSARWTVRTKQGASYRARHVVMATGPLHVPFMPKLPGLERFQGKVFHSARWDHAYDLNDKHVVSIGTGGSAIQYVPRIAPRVRQLYVFQRTPAWVIPRDERAYSALEKWAFRKLPVFRKLHRARLYWSNESRVWPIFHPRLAHAIQPFAKAFIHLQVKDRELARRLTPDYTIACKRVLISNEYFPTFNRANVELVTDAIREIKEHSVVTADGVERPADCIILGTGFVVDPRIYMQHFEIVGLGGRRLREDWKDGAEAHLGVDVAGYPNLFQLLGPNTTLGHNSVIFMIEAQVHYIMQCFALLRDQGAAYLELKPEVQRAYNERLQRELAHSVWSSGCHSWYQQADGKNIALWPWSTWRFWLETRRVEPSRYRLRQSSLAHGAARLAP